MSRTARQRTAERQGRRKVALIAGSTGFVSLLVAVQVLSLPGAVAMARGRILVVWGAGTALWAGKELWETRPDPQH